MSAIEPYSFFLGVAATLIVEGIAGLTIAWIVVPRLRARKRGATKNKS